MRGRNTYFRQRRRSAKAIVHSVPALISVRIRRSVPSFLRCYRLDVATGGKIGNLNEKAVFLLEG